MTESNEPGALMAQTFNNRKELKGRKEEGTHHEVIHDLTLTHRS